MAKMELATIGESGVNLDLPELEGIRTSVSKTNRNL